MATVTGTNTDKIDQLAQVLYGQQSQMRLLQTAFVILFPAVIALGGWLGYSVTSTQRDIAAIQVNLHAAEQRLDRIELRIDRIDERLGKIEKTLERIDERTGKKAE